MTTLTVALLQVEAAGRDQAENLRRGDAACRRAAASGADIALFPEMWNIGYALEDAPPAADAGRRHGDAVRGSADDCGRGTGRESRRGDGDRRPTDAGHAADDSISAEGAFVTHFRRLAAELGMAIALTFLEEWPGGPRNSAALIDRRGTIVLTYAKVHTSAFDAPEAALTPGDDFPVAVLDTAAGPVRVGVMICYDREFPETARILALNGAELILAPNACPMEENRTGQLRARAFENMVAVALANYPATHDDCDGHSVAFHPCICGEDEVSRDTLVARAGDGEEVCLARFDLDELRDWRRREVWGAKHRRPSLYGRLVEDT